MQDRFRFRVWYKSFGEIIPKMLYDAEQTYDYMYGEPEIIPAKSFGSVLDNEEEYIVMQCTGKKDKHNKLIYEGDIVRLTGKNKMTFEYVVKYRLSEYRYVLEYANGKLKGHKARDFSKEYAQVKNLYDGGYEVIGNIYENPELLEV